MTCLGCSMHCASGAQTTTLCIGCPMHCPRAERRLRMTNAAFVREFKRIQERTAAQAKAAGWRRTGQRANFPDCSMRVACKELFPGRGPVACSEG